MPTVFEKFFIKNRRTFRVLFFLLADIVLIISSVILAFLVRFEGQVPGQYYLNIAGIIILALLITIPIFFFFKLYSFTWIYVSSAELISLIKASGLSFLILTASFFCIKRSRNFYRFPPVHSFYCLLFHIFVLWRQPFCKKNLFGSIPESKGKGKKRKNFDCGRREGGRTAFKEYSGHKDDSFPAGRFY